MADPPEVVAPRRSLDDAHDMSSTLDSNRGSEYNVRVAVRVRPLLPKEVSERCRECIGVGFEENQVIVGKTVFTFDHVFGSEASQEHTFEETALPLVEGLGLGLNATLLAYGQTSAGKTFTLGSCSHAAVPEEQQGIIPRFVNALFRDIIYAKRTEADIQVRASFVELHNEDINDLLDPSFLEQRRIVTIREDPVHGVVVQGMKEVEVKKPSELLRCLEKGAVFRTTASTLMNEQSSRSHAIFSVIVEQHVHATGDTVSAKIRFADLAGSERAKKTGTVGERFREGVNINQGLLALGNVISALGDSKLSKQHVPYRDSKLTRMVQDSLGGNSRTLMIACVSPADVHFGETLNTLKYANRAKNIKNKVVVNVNNQNPEIAKLKEQIQELQVELVEARQLQQRRPPPSPSRWLPCEAPVAQDAVKCPLKCDCLQRSPVAIDDKADADFKKLCEPSNLAEAEEELAANTRKSRELRLRNVRLERLVEQLREDTQDVPEPVAEPLAEDDLREAQRSRREADVDSPPRDNSSLGDFAAEDGEAEEALAHVEEDAREEERHVVSQRELDSTVQDLDEVIMEKEVLLDQLTKQSAVFHSMKARYEMRLQELQGEVEHAGEEKEHMLKEMKQLMSAAQSAPATKDAHARRVSEEASKRKAHLEGRLREVNRQLAELKRRQVEAQRLLRLKEQQEQQIQRMREEISRLRGQKQVVLSRMKFDEQQHRLWRKRWTSRLNELTKKSAELQNKTKRQDKLLQLKTEEAAKSAKKIEELRREQQQHLDASRRRVQVERGIVRAGHLREANERLQRELEEREDRVQQMETMLAERERLERMGSAGADELQEVEETIDTLDAQIDFDSECIAQSQTDILRLTSSSGGRPRTRSSEAASLLPEALCMTTSADSIVARLGNLEEARVTCLACLQSISDLRADNGRLQTRLAELETEASQRGAQLEELQARERLAETKWAEQANAMQRLHLDKEVYLLSRVERNLTDEHGIVEAPSEAASGSTPLQQLLESPTVAQLHAAEEVPADGATASSEALLRLLQCRTQQIELLSQQAEHLHQSLERAERTAAEAEMSASLARWEVDKMRAEVDERQCAAGAVEAASEAQAATSVPHALPPLPASPEPAPCVGSEGDSPKRREASARSASPPKAEAEGKDSELSSDEEAETSDAVEALRSFVSAAESNSDDLAVIEGVAEMASGQLRSMWMDIGMDADSQKRHLHGLANGIVRLCSRELRRHAGSRSRLRQAHGELSAMVSALGSTQDCGAMEPLHQQHASLQATARDELDRRVLRLQGTLRELFGLNLGDLAQQVSASASNSSGGAENAAASVQIALLDGSGVQCLPGRGDPASLLKQRDLDVLGLSNDGKGDWVQQPVNETFEILAERQTEVDVLHAEMLSQFHKVDADLRDHFAVLGSPVQKQEDFFASRGSGLPALAASRRELLRLQHRARLRVAEGRVRMAEQWMELGTSGSEQEAVLQRLRACAERDALSELRALGEETRRLETKIESRKDILRKFEAWDALEQDIKDFEREASDSSRLRGSSTKLLQEEQQRLKFRKRKERMMEELISMGMAWEQAHGERFLRKGLAIRDYLQQDLDAMRELGGLSLLPQSAAAPAVSLHRHSSQTSASASHGHLSQGSAASGSNASLANAGSAAGLQGVPKVASVLASQGGGIAPVVAASSGTPSAPRSARGLRSAEASLASRVLTSVPEQRRRASPSMCSTGALRFSPVGRESPPH